MREVDWLELGVKKFQPRKDLRKGCLVGRWGESLNLFQTCLLKR